MHEMNTGCNRLIYMEISIEKRPQNDATLAVVNPFKNKKAKRLGFLMKFSTLSQFAFPSSLPFVLNYKIFFYLSFMFQSMSIDNSIVQTV